MPASGSRMKDADTSLAVLKTTERFRWTPGANVALDRPGVVTAPSHDARLTLAERLMVTTGF